MIRRKCFSILSFHKVLSIYIFSFEHFTPPPLAKFLQRNRTLFYKLLPSRLSCFTHTQKKLVYKENNSYKYRFVRNEAFMKT